MNAPCPAPDLQMALLDELREGAALTADLALHLEQCASCQAAAERLRRMVATWSADEVDENALAAAAAKFYDQKTTPSGIGWFDVVPFASAGVAVGYLALVATGTIGLPWKSRSVTDARPQAAAEAREGAAPGNVAQKGAPRVAPAFVTSNESEKRVRSQPHIETTRGIAPLVDGLRVEVRSGESVRVALNGGHASTVEGPCLVEFWSTPLEAGGWRIIREESAVSDERGTRDEAIVQGPGVAVPGSAAQTPVPAESAGGPVAAPSPSEARPSPGAPATAGANPAPAAPSGARAATEGATPEGATTSNEKTSPGTREGSAAAALKESLSNQTQGAEGGGGNLVSVRAWARAAAALREDDFDGADRAFEELSHSSDGATRDAARLARAQLWISRGREQAVRPVLEQLAQGGATPLVRQRASQLLNRDVH